MGGWGGGVGVRESSACWGTRITSKRACSYVLIQDNYIKTHVRLSPSNYVIMPMGYLYNHNFGGGGGGGGYNFSEYMKCNSCDKSW